MKKLFYLLLVVGWMASCKSLPKEERKTENPVTVQFDLKVKTTPFEGCPDTANVLGIQQRFTKGGFTILVDSNISNTYEHKYNEESEIDIHRFTSLQDTSVRFSILVDSGITDTIFGKRLEQIQPEEGVVEFVINDDSALFKASLYEWEQDGVVQYVYENRIQYYDPKSKRLYFIFVVQQKKNRAAINMNCECEFQKAIESFTVVY